MNVRSTMHCRDAPSSMQPIGNDHHHLCTLSSFTPTTAGAIVRLVNKCPSKCCALDPGPTTLLKTNIDIIAPVLADIINVSLESATVPAEMKHAVVTHCSRRQVWTQMTSKITALYLISALYQNC